MVRFILCLSLLFGSLNCIGQTRTDCIWWMASDESYSHLSSGNIDEETGNLLFNIDLLNEELEIVESASVDLDPAYKLVKGIRMTGRLVYIFQHQTRNSLFGILEHRSPNQFRFKPTSIYGTEVFAWLNLDTEILAIGAGKGELILESKNIETGNYASNNIPLGYKDKVTEVGAYSAGKEDPDSPKVALTMLRDLKENDYLEFLLFGSETWMLHKSSLRFPEDYHLTSGRIQVQEAGSFPGDQFQPQIVTGTYALDAKGTTQGIFVCSNQMGTDSYSEKMDIFQFYPFTDWPDFEMFAEEEPKVRKKKKEEWREFREDYRVFWKTPEKCKNGYSLAVGEVCIPHLRTIEIREDDSDDRPGIRYEEVFDYWEAKFLIGMALDSTGQVVWNMSRDLRNRNSDVFLPNSSMNTLPETDEDWKELVYIDGNKVKRQLLSPQRIGEQTSYSIWDSGDIGNSNGWNLQVERWATADFDGALVWGWKERPKDGKPGKPSDNISILLKKISF